MQAFHVQQLPRRAVGFGFVKDQRPVEADHASDGLGQFADGNVFAGAYVDERRRVLLQQPAKALLVEVHQKAASLRHVVGVEQFTAWRAGAPDDNFTRTGCFGLRSLANERGKHVRAGQIEVVARAIKIGRHGGEVAGAVLAVVAPAHLDPRDLGDRVGPVGRLQRPGKEVLLFDRLRAELGVDAGGAEKEQAFDYGGAAGLDDVGLNHQIVADEVRRIAVVGEDTADFGCGQKDIVGFLAGKESVDGDLVQKFQLLVGAGENVAIRSEE